MKITKEFLKEQYLVFGKSGYGIAKELGLKRWEIDNILNKHKIKRRSIAESRRPKDSKNIPNHKWCARCKTDKPYSDFSKNHRDRLGLDAYCKKCMAKAAIKYYDGRNCQRQKIKANLILEFGNRCSKCGIENLPIAAFVFHHHTEKMGSSGYKLPSYVLTRKNVKLIHSEKSKWVLLCANCHSIVHSKNKSPATKFEL
jgi:hypothetical protein